MTATPITSNDDGYLSAYLLQVDLMSVGNAGRDAVQALLALASASARFRVCQGGNLKSIAALEAILSLCEGASERKYINTGGI
jgi:hypothetical protein